MYNDQKQRERRRELRKNKTEAEKILWQELRGRKLGNLKFYRQYSVGPYILDFFCPQVRLAIELDGSPHQEAIEYDKEREFFLKDKNIQTVRFWNSEVLKNIEGVLSTVKKMIDFKNENR